VFNYYGAASDHYGVNVLTGNTDWTITNNSFYQTLSRAITTSSTTSGVRISSAASNNNLISGNYIGGTAPLCGGTPQTYTGTATNGIIFRGLQLTVGTTTATSVQGNTIQNLSLTTGSGSTSTSGISLLTGRLNVGNVTGNTIGSQSVTNSIVYVNANTTAGIIVTGILAGTGTGELTNISNNTIGGITVSTSSTATISVRGIGFQGTTGTFTVNNNIIGSTTIANSITNSSNNSVIGIFGGASIATATQNITNNTVANIRSTTTGTAGQVIGILAQGTSGGIYNTTGNTVRDLTNGAPNVGTSAAASIIGIASTAATTAGQTVSQNTIYNLSNTNATAINTTMAGLYYAGPTTGTNVVSRNLIYGLSMSATGTVPIMHGINVNSGTTTFHNNMVSIGTGVAGNYGINGINETTGTNNYYFNSVYVGGSVNGSLNTFAFVNSTTVNTRIFRNNIFTNARANAGAGRSYAVSVGGTGVNPTGLTINNNDYWAIGTGTVFGRYNAADVLTLAAWQTAVGQDAQSVNVDPLFIAPAAATPDLHITSGTTTLESGAAAIAGITIDFDNQTRPGTPSGSNSGVGPDIGADEFDGINPNLCSGTPAAGGTATSSVALICAGSSVTFTLTGATGGPGIAYQWQTSPAGANTWVDVVSATATVSSFAITGNTDVRCKVTCVPSGLFVTSTVVTVNGMNCQFNIVKSAATFTSIAGTGTSMSGWRASATNTDDNLSTSQPIGFSFPYKGVNYTNFSVSTNGFLTFNVGTAAVGTLTGAYGYQNTQFSTTGGTVTTLAPFYEDLVTPGNPGTAAGLAAAMKYQVDGTAPNRVLTVEWVGMETFGNPGPNLNYQVKIYETTGVIEYVYGTMEGFNGTQNFAYTYTLGLNGPVISAVPTVLELQTQQVENVQNFSALPSNALTRVPDCNIKYTFTPSNYGVADPSPGIPANDEPATATTVSVNGGPCISLCGTYYTSKNATASAGITVCSAATPGTPDDDVWFKFIATTTQQTVTVRGAGGYDAVLQLFSDAGITPINCVNTTAAGFTETYAATGLTIGTTYYIRVYHAAAGSGTNGDFSLCVNEVIPPPANDDICNAINLTAGATCTGTAGTTIAATASPQTVCGGNADDDVWYRWTAVLASDTIKVQSNAGFNAHIEVFSSSDNTCTGTLTSLGCINATSTGGLEFFVGTLTPGNTYFVRVYHTASGTGTGTFSICAIAAPPACVTGLTPATGTSVDATVGTTLNWTAAGSPTSPPSGYDVYFDTNNPPTTLVSPNQAGTTYATGVLTPNTVYYWRIEPKNAVGTTTGCTVSNINTNAPACPTAPNPGNATNTCLSAAATTLSWTASPGATGYDVYFDAGAGPATTLVSPNQAGVTYSAGVLTAGPYAWRVIARNGNGPSVGCADWTFTVNAKPTAGTTPSGTTNICTPATQLYTATTDIGTAYQWKLNGVNIGGATSSTYTASVSGNYQVVVTVLATGCKDSSANATLIVNPLPTAPTVSPSAATVCPGVATLLTASGSEQSVFSNIKITEVTLFKTGTGQTVTYPAYALGEDFVEISNVSASPIDVSGLTISDYANASATVVHPYTIPASTIIPANSIMTIHLGTGTDDIPNRYYNTGGTTDSWLSSSTMGVVLKNGATIVDVVGCGTGFAFDAGIGVTAGDWSGVAPSASGFAGVIRSAATDNNIGADWVQSNTPSPLQSIGTYNGGYTPVSTSIDYTWSPNTGLFTNATLTTPYTGGIGATVYAAPTATQTYAATATSAAPASCGVSTNVTVTITNTGVLAGTSGGPTVCTTSPVAAVIGTTYSDGTCNPISKVVPSGASPVSGDITTCVYIDPTILPTYNGGPYVQRHIDITPVTAAATSTGTITLYFTDAEFATYNANNGSFPDLPTVAGGGNADPNLGNVKVMQYHGTPNTTPSTPNNYSAGTSTAIPPASIVTSYNGTNWTITFPVTGFSGFYVFSGAGALPISVNYLQGTKQGTNHNLNWKVTCTSASSATMVLQRSGDNRSFTSINTITADALRCAQPFNYVDASPLAGINYYRLRITDNNGKVTHSNTIAMVNKQSGIDIVGVVPNPVMNNGLTILSIASAQKGMVRIVITDVTGRQLQTQTEAIIAGSNAIPMNVAKLAGGSYQVTVITDDGKATSVRFVKQ
jgi:hypothetical protein